ncbi:UDP-N-acetylmuramoyl-L-alanyl-D-glutamate--2,6-diaminopimelate ligase [Kineococcus sp. T13]|uniref:UDP-N-acetylmuramoyl-L-alanyl-D-glutamate--2, 6-diaminopimelate ligase n=1 Tax=Kineococcus vitellinus TaxID=2696565 RepID=UPI0014121202|nr:UDP-N-acetylmuramoyl-L-alanyl-D-glutamate--2,6-diaminopimelate ligase [Kineococcus vitellinus]NAZ76279.1 UDP-N-acetylmuramoyl-L-alanyl-D-glutamate--2,6-diaminopimelate ligase [Kineococcus vitellinus]
MTDGPGAGSAAGPLTLVDIAHLLGVAAPTPAGPAAVPVTGVTLDSRRVQPGDLYAALPGANVHGARFCAQAAAAGAVAVLTDPAGRDLATAARDAQPAAEPLPLLVVDDPRAVLGDLAARVHGLPGRRLTSVGVTGTNGKTTTAYLVESLLRAAGWPTGLLGTVETRIGAERVSSVRTTPEAPDLHALLARMVAAGVRGVALEVSSHALAQHRVDGLVLDVAVFTNLSQDHLDFHGSMAEYFAAKARLFTPAHARRGVVWTDPADPEGWGARMAERATVPVVTVGPAGGAGGAGSLAARPAPDWVVHEVRAERARSTFRLSGPGAELALTSPLPGGFNVANTALAAVAALLLGVPAEVVERGSAQAEGVPGRMQAVGTGAPGEPLVVVDYAHTPDALERVLRTLRAATPGRLVAVLGAGGDRDRGKRPLMGAAAAALADVVVVTDDNPRSEPPADVRAAVLAGARGGRAEVLEVADRAAAVEAALARCAGADDTVLLAGKGHESGQEVAGVVTPFDDRLVAAEALRRRAQQRARGSAPARTQDHAPGGTRGHAQHQAESAAPAARGGGS